MGEDWVSPSELDEATVVAPAAHVGRVDVGDQLVLVDGPAGRALALNPTASIVWQCLDGETPLATLIDELDVAFGAPRDTIAADVMSLAQSLGMLGLLDGVGRSLMSLPVDIEFAPVDEDPCVGDAPGDPEFDDRYLAAPPNG